ncbi:unnamed protein product [Cryptosporidium hominis]|uniref:3-oxo-5-alpha-steroid 4-dehydrogenase C-terminal domain containing protein n=1 Tax=Cryptosporidium hominis TaxID=237895 RepID=A0A0S4TFW1_CRYHO|nr:hypothetical protein [Cryptosporidium hominis TU502]PPS93455.1 3-oxo-5-alpha-steroid 4-dehydrogenase C-terminal domain containing protein [Cryptosporidium hominis]CUV06122.1 unnamed protein product [Cryptosporidium hominis]|eukprot:PPS93455.1 3-oxo-5-alpha-steroid 4-dehydrogenase C-terminal domain containing protein [Cryptosporidium hominis]
MQETDYKLVNGTHSLLTTYFLVSTVAVIFSSVVRFANLVTTHGKLRKKNLASENIGNTSSDKVIYLILGLSVNKGWFRYFYLVGVFTTSICVYLSYPNCYRLLFFLIHVIRRLYEEVFISYHNTNYSRMSIFVFLFGISYYIIMPITLLATQDFYGKFVVLQYISFAAFSLVQHKSHVKLSNIRRANSEEYGIPYGGMFKFVSCPHYFSEIGIYLSLFFDAIFNSNNLHIATALLYIISCMYVNAIRAHKWYINYYKESYLSLNRKAIIPYIV